ncbi:hypothetical protein Dsin_018401 [Dipteronia sinensis]|uniref:Uncharacterized protein n=1 Tax=Dipteronia sinensis TaxID=43782 RepID=A0AAE0E1R2_9ROSI|nr:hypothetical protein Dsin_018401 [Dipteronia sinensis]
MKFEIDKFDGTGDFEIWRRKVKALLSQQKTLKVIEGDNEKLSDENKAIILLNSLPDSFKDVKVAIKYGRTSLTLEECISTLKSNELELKIRKKDNGEKLFARGRQHVKVNGNNYNNKSKGMSKTPNHISQSKNINSFRRCYYSGKERHLKKNNVLSLSEKLKKRLKLMVMRM